MPPDVTEATILASLDRRVPSIAAVREALGDVPGWLVGGTVRDLALGREVRDLDVVVEGDPVAVADRLGGHARAHERFGTVALVTDGGEIDFARARAEKYPSPGALPVVRPAGIEEDLARRDFTVNSMAIALAEPSELLDPHGGLADLGEGTLRVLHERSLADDPTRAIRGARYAARLRFRLEPGTETLVRGADMGTVSRERVESELRKLAREDDPAAALRLLVEWGLAQADPALGARALAVASEARFAGADSAAAFLTAADVALGAYRAPSSSRARELAEIRAGRPSELAAAARGARGVDLAIARALGANWIDDYADTWRAVRLEIGGDDLIAAGVPEGPAVGAGLAAALSRKLDGEISGADAELAAALEAARR